jgi:hypothetical protein
MFGDEDHAQSRILQYIAATDYAFSFSHFQDSGDVTQAILSWIDTVPEISFIRPSGLKKTLPPTIIVTPDVSGRYLQLRR